MSPHQHRRELSLSNNPLTRPLPLEPGLQQRKEALRPILMHLPPRIFLLGVIDKVMHIALEGAIAAGRVCIEPTACLDREVGRFLHRLDSKVPRRLDDDTSLAADPGDDRGSVFVVMASTGLAFLAAPPGLATQ